MFPSEREYPGIRGPHPCAVCDQYRDLLRSMRISVAEKEPTGDDTRQCDSEEVGQPASVGNKRNSAACGEEREYSKYEVARRKAEPRP